MASIKVFEETKNHYFLFIGVNLSGSNLTGVDLGSANLRNADLSNCNLTNIDLNEQPSYQFPRTIAAMDISEDKSKIGNYHSSVHSIGLYANMISFAF